jgi:hypothetical protein
MLFIRIVVASLEYDDVAETAIRDKTVQITARGDFQDTHPYNKKTSVFTIKYKPTRGTIHAPSP